MSNVGSLNGQPFDDDDDDRADHRLVIEGPETVPGAAELLADGFVPLEWLTGARRVAEAWPEQHRRVLPETRPAMQTEFDDTDIWFVRSPWPSISAANALSIVWAGQSRVGTDTMPGTAIEALHHAQAVAILGLDESNATSYLRSLPHMVGWELLGE